MKWAVACLLLVLPAFASAVCPSPTPDGHACVRWTPPADVFDEDGNLVEIAGYTIHWGTQAGDYSGSFYVDDPNATEAGIAPGRGPWYFAMTTQSVADVSSEYSAEVLGVLGKPPAMASNAALRIIENPPRGPTVPVSRVQYTSSSWNSGQHGATFGANLTPGNMLLVISYARAGDSNFDVASQSGGNPWNYEEYRVQPADVDVRREMGVAWKVITNGEEAERTINAEWLGLSSGHRFQAFEFDFGGAIVAPTLLEFKTATSTPETTQDLTSMAMGPTATVSDRIFAVAAAGIKRTTAGLTIDEDAVLSFTGGFTDRLDILPAGGIAHQFALSTAWQELDPASGTLSSTFSFTDDATQNRGIIGGILVFQLLDSTLLANDTSQDQVSDPAPLSGFGSLIQKASVVTLDVAAFGLGETATFSQPTTAGNLLVCYHFTGDADSTAPTEDAWLLAKKKQNLTDADALAIYYRIADGTETDVTPGSLGNDDHMVLIAEYEGPFAAAPLDAVGEASRSGLANVDIVASGPTSQDSVLAVAAVGLRSDVFIANSFDAGLSLIENVTGNVNKGLHVGSGALDSIQTLTTRAVLSGSPISIGALATFKRAAAAPVALFERGTLRGVMRGVGH